MNPFQSRLPIRTLVASLLALASLTACVPLLVGGAATGGSVMALDRRTTGAQVDDETIELKAMNRVREAIGSRGHVNSTSYNRMLLVTGEVPTEADKATLEQEFKRIDNVRSVVNELAVMETSSLATRSRDTFITSKVKATFVEAKDMHANAFKVVTERSTVFLMGRVTEQEADRAADLARRVSGVQKVVRVFELITEAELADLKPKMQQ